MNARRFSTLNILATGFFVLLVTVLVLFWARWGCESVRRSLLPEGAWQLDVDVSALPSFKTGQEPNGPPYAFHATMEAARIDEEAFGVTQFQEAYDLDAPDSPVYAWSTNDKDPQLYYDRSLGMVVYRSTVGTPEGDGRVRLRTVVAYAGPAGVGETPDAKLGRFRDLFARLIRGNLDRLIVYDRNVRRFFAIDWPGKTVKQGPALLAEVAAPVNFGWPRKQPRCLNLYLDTPKPHYTYGVNPDRALVLDAMGNIRMLDLDTLGYYPASVGRLPAPDVLFPPVRQTRPDDLFAFNVLPVFAGKGETYDGCAVAVVSRDATSMKLEVFDANGVSVAVRETTFSDPFDIARSVGRRTPVSTVAALYYRLPGAMALTATKFILESLHPPVLLWLSYFIASDIEATAGYRSLFVLPNSFAAMRARDVGLWWLPRFMAALPFLLPGVVLGVALAMAVGRDARRMGLPVRARRLLMAATVLFALPAYVTYRITRPATARVTCQNCGRDRWVDREKCHHCGSPWLVPELIPPTWRVIGRPEEQVCTDPSPRPEETTSRKSEV